MTITLEFHNQKLVDKLKNDVYFIKALEQYELWVPKPGHIDGTIIIVANKTNSSTVDVLNKLANIILTHIKRLFPDIHSFRVNDNEDFENHILNDGDNHLVSVKAVYIKK